MQSFSHAIVNPKEVLHNLLERLDTFTRLGKSKMKMQQARACTLNENSSTLSRLLQLKPKIYGRKKLLKCLVPHRTIKAMPYKLDVSHSILYQSGLYIGAKGSSVPCHLPKMCPRVRLKITTHVRGVLKCLLPHGTTKATQTNI